MLKKTTLAVLGLAFAGVAAAGTMGCEPGNVTVPCEMKKWDLGVQALYMQPTYTGNHSYFHDTALSPARYQDFDPDWGWGYRLEGSYHYSTGTDITVTWMHYDVDTDRSGYQFNQNQNVSPVSLADARLSNNNLFDQVNVVKGQHVDIGLVKNARFYGGLQFAKVRNEIDYGYPTTLGLTANQYTDFKGVGPVAGVDYAYELANGFSLTANGAASILYGNGRYNYQLVQVSTGGVVPNNNFKASSKSVVPALEGKVGLNYAHQMPQGTLNFELGYQVVNYFNVLKWNNQATFTVNPTTLDKSDFGLYGGYAGVKWVAPA